jgi:hypothetical protein
VQLTQHRGNVANLFPQIFRRIDGTWAVQWLSTRSGDPRIHELALSDVGRYPAAAREHTLLPPGYSHRLSTTGSPGEYLAAWVQGAVGAEEIYIRFIRPAAPSP